MLSFEKEQVFHNLVRTPNSLDFNFKVIRLGKAGLEYVMLRKLKMKSRSESMGLLYILCILLLVWGGRETFIGQCWQGMLPLPKL